MSPIYPSPTETDQSQWRNVRQCAIKCARRDRKIQTFDEKQHSGRRVARWETIEAARDFAASSARLSSAFELPINHIPNDDDKCMKGLTSLSVYTMEELYNNHIQAIEFAKLIARSTSDDIPVSNIELIDRIGKSTQEASADSEFVLEALRAKVAQRVSEAASSTDLPSHASDCQAPVDSTAVDLESDETDTSE